MSSGNMDRPAFGDGSFNKADAAEGRPAGPEFDDGDGDIERGPHEEGGLGNGSSPIGVISKYLGLMVFLSLSPII
ncbi:hypothetical protein [Metabacillus sp. RGM 3146]|uniref:hypothetical protein n=1 Tax=Metabacillus sp. RGM 3146 TaxID=3401092 RepID=UPI003B99AA8D